LVISDVQIKKYVLEKVLISFLIETRAQTFLLY